MLGSKASGVTGGIPLTAADTVCVVKPPGPERLVSGESQAVSVCAASRSGSWSATHPAGFPIASTAVRPIPERISSPALRIEWPRQD